ncbi:hypothetical protein CEE45_07915 [Candidatus Heimdallarchaeota archaeon B3_Heim]|nr:MAG: hypothetical protein CEE45_07915 [Candidatus Heimdallarchaeota archaeon B3_Heim]
MASKLSVLGIGLVIIGVIVFSLFNVAWIVFPPFGGRTSDLTNEVTISAGNLAGEVEVGRIPASPLMLNLKVIFIFSADAAYSCEFSLIFKTNSFPTGASLAGTTRSYDKPEGTSSKQISLSFFDPLSQGEEANVFIRVSNTGSSPIRIFTRRVVIVQFLGILTPVLLALSGVIVTVVGLRQGKAPKVKRKRAAPAGGWEPTLQWSGGSGGAKPSTNKKRPKMAISSTKGQPTQKRTVVKKAVPKGGAQAGCKFCGKQVPNNAFFCPHCYGKLR